jgi:hypothetical protein
VGKLSTDGDELGTLGEEAIGRLHFDHMRSNRARRTLTCYGLCFFSLLVQNNVAQWSKFVTPEEMQGFTAGAGLHMQQLSGMVYNPLSSTYAASPSEPAHFPPHLNVLCSRARTEAVRTLAFHASHDATNASSPRRQWTLDEGDTSMNYIAYATKPPDLPESR